MDKQIAVPSYKGILQNNKKEQIIGSWGIGGSQNHYIESKKPALTPQKMSTHCTIPFIYIIESEN